MSSQELIANELQMFIQNAIDTMDETCVSNSENVICSGKVLLFRLGIEETSLQDNITMFPLMKLKAL